MSERKRKGIVFGTLIVAVIWGAWNLFPADPGQSEEPSVTGILHPAPSVHKPTAADPHITDPDSNFAVWRADPFARRQYAKRAAGDDPDYVCLKLTAVSIGGRFPMVVIDGLVLGIGDHVEGWQVTEISEAAVKLENGPLNMILSLGDRQNAYTEN